MKVQGGRGRRAGGCHLQWARTVLRALGSCPHARLRVCVCVEKAGATCPCAIRNEERRRAWRASGESKLQPLPSCEVW